MGKSYEEGGKAAGEAKYPALGTRERGNSEQAKTATIRSFINIDRGILLKKHGRGGEKPAHRGYREGQEVLGIAELEDDR